MGAGGGLPNASATYSHLFDIVQSEGSHFHSFHEDEVLRDEMGADFLTVSSKRVTGTIWMLLNS